MAIALLVACFSGWGCEFPECGSDPDHQPGGFCRPTADRSAAAGSAAPPTPSSPQQALIGFRAHPQYAGAVPAWLFTGNLGTFDLDALVDGTPPNDPWRWSTDGEIAVYEQNGQVGEFLDIIQLFAPPRGQRFDRTYEFVDFDNSARLLHFGSDGSLIVCDGRSAPLREHYAINGFTFDWTRTDGAVERHALLYDPSDPAQLWLGLHQLVATTRTCF